MSEQPGFFTELKQLIVEFFEAKLKLYKIGAYEKIAGVTAVLFSSIVLVILCFFMLLFLSIAGGFYFAELLQSTPQGFMVIFGIYFIVFIVIFIFRKQLLEKVIADRVIHKLFEEEKNDK